MNPIDPCMVKYLICRINLLAGVFTLGCRMSARMFFSSVVFKVPKVMRLFHIPSAAAKLLPPFRELMWSQASWLGSGGALPPSLLHYPGSLCGTTDDLLRNPRGPWNTDLYYPELDTKHVALYTHLTWILSRFHFTQAVVLPLFSCVLTLILSKPCRIYWL